MITSIIVWLVFALTVMAALVVIPYILGSKAMFVYGYREGFASLLSDGIENGKFDRAIGSMRGKIIHPDGEITDGDDTQRSGLVWLGIWPLHSAMTFDTEQTKIVNMDDGSLGLQMQKYPHTIYIPIISTERLIILNLQLKNNVKVNLDMAITYEMTNIYTAKLHNRGGTKLLKMNAEEGLREKVSELGYDGKDKEAAILTIKNATGPRGDGWDDLVKSLNSADCGAGTLSEVTGYRIISINLLKVSLSNPETDKVFLKRITAEEEAAASEIGNVQLARNTVRLGEATAKAEARMVTQTLRRIKAQEKLGDQQAIALALEKSNAQVITIGGGGGASPLISLDPKWGKKTETGDKKEEKPK